MKNKQRMPGTQDLITRMRVKITLTDEILGTKPGDPEVYRTYVGSKAPDAATMEEEVSMLGADEVADKGKTVFLKMEDGTPCIGANQILGFFKEACSAFNRMPGKPLGSMTAHKKVIDQNIFVEPQYIPIVFEGEVGSCQRPLRAQTQQGERISLTESETAPELSTLTFEVCSMNKNLLPTVRAWLDYGSWHGLGQWRNSGKGTFIWEELEQEC